MTASAIVVIETAEFGALPASLRRRVASGRVSVRSVPRDSLSRVLSALGREPPSQGLAACRYLGQTGRSADGWIACADPVRFDAVGDRLRMRPVPATSAAGWLELTCSALTAALGGEGGYGFESVDGLGYLRGRPLEGLPVVPPAAASGTSPYERLPSPLEASDFHRLYSEIQMVLHKDDDVGHPDATANGLWLWGGGRPPDVAGTLPPFTGGDPLLEGYWRLAGSTIESDVAQLADRVERHDDLVVACGADEFTTAFPALWRANGRGRRLRLLFADGVDIDLAWWHRYLPWRLRRRPLTVDGE